MAHSTVHITFGVVVATIFCLPRLARAWRRGEPLATRFRNWLLLAAGLGVYAIMPALMRRAGFPDAWWGSQWMNIFLLHPLITSTWQGGGVIGPLMLAGVMILPYTLLIIAIRRKAVKSRRGKPCLAEFAAVLPTPKHQPRSFMPPATSPSASKSLTTRMLDIIKKIGYHYGVF